VCICSALNWIIAEALLTDLQNTTEVLKRANLSDRYMQAEDKEV
jgi:hypothetical protein